jgi:antitoxin component YwqK of YwqJK toxin-antitoxin module
MKNLLAFIGFLVFSTNIAAQNYTHNYFLDWDLNSTDSANSSILGKGYKQPNFFQLDAFGKDDGNLYFKVQFTDSSLSDLNGEFQRYYPNGRLMTEGHYNKNEEDGLWTKWDSANHKTDSLIMSNGNQISAASFKYYSNGNLQRFDFKSSDLSNYVVALYNEDGSKKSTSELHNNVGTYTIFDKGEVKVKSLNKAPGNKAEFPGGHNQFKLFIEKNINLRDIISGKIAPGNYVVTISFWVNPDGSLSNIMPESGNGRGIEDEAIRVIKLSPNWLPAMQGGIPIKETYRQSFGFQYTSDGLVRYIIN